jgi:hypothetical protein
MQSNHLSQSARQRAMLDLVASHGYLMGQSLAHEQRRQALLAEAEQSRLLKETGLAPRGSGSRLARMRFGLGLALVRLGLRLRGPAPARPTYSV